MIFWSPEQKRQLESHALALPRIGSKVAQLSSQTEGVTWPHQAVRELGSISQRTPYVISTMSLSQEWMVLKDIVELYILMNFIMIIEDTEVEQIILLT